MPRIFEGLVKVDYGQFYLVDGDLYESDLIGAFRGQTNGLCGAVDPDGLFLLTATHTGRVSVTMDVHENLPVVDDMWEDIVEVSFEATQGVLTLVEMMTGNSRDLPLAPGEYRVRYSARGMDHGADIVRRGETAKDNYHLAFWPAAHAPDAIVKQTSKGAAYWNEWVKRPNQDVS